MIVVVTGSRDWTDIVTVGEELRALPKDTILIHGAARGLDTIAAHIATGLGFEVRAYPADWDKYGRAAGPIRNKQMLDLKPDLVLAFPLPGSKGTVNCINQARKMGLKVKICEDRYVGNRTTGS